MLRLAAIFAAGFACLYAMLPAAAREPAASPADMERAEIGSGLAELRH